MNDRLTTSELAELIGCKPNQCAAMIKWLREHRWIHEIDKNGIPIVMRLYRDRKLGVVDGDASSVYADGPNRHAFDATPAKRKGAKRHNSDTELP